MNDNERTDLDRAGLRCTLDQLKPAETAIIREITTKGSQRRRLLDLGFVQDALVTMIYTSPTGNPTAYKILGTVIALRNKDAENIIVEITGGSYR